MDGFRMPSFFFSSRRRHTRFSRDWSSDVCSSDLIRLSRNARAVAVATAASRTPALWPVAVEASAADLAAVGPLLAADVTLAGSARLVAEVRGLGPIALRGTFETTAATAQVRLGGPATLSNVRATIPVVWHAGDADAPGSVTVERVAGYGLVLRDVTSSASLVDGRLILPDIRYAHAGGRGAGWLEAFVDGRPLPLRARLDAEHVDLAVLVQE